MIKSCAICGGDSTKPTGRYQPNLCHHNIKVETLMSTLGYSREVAEAHVKQGYTIADIRTDYMIPANDLEKLANAIGFEYEHISGCDPCFVGDGFEMITVESMKRILAYIQDREIKARKNKNNV